MCEVGTVVKISDYQPEVSGFNPWPGQGSTLGGLLSLHHPWTGMLTLSYTGLFRLVLHGGGHKVPAAFFSATVKATAIKLGTLTN